MYIHTHPVVTAQPWFDKWSCTPICSFPNNFVIKSDVRSTVKLRLTLIQIIFIKLEPLLALALNQILIYKVCRFPGYKYPHHGWFQAANVTSPNTKFQRDAQEHTII